MKYRNWIWCFFSLALGCQKVSEDKSFPENYHFKKWVEFPVYIHSVKGKQNGIYNDRKGITAIPAEVISNRKQADTLYLSRYFDTLNFERYSAVFSKQIVLNEYENISRTNPRFWLNFDKKFYYIRYGETITSTSNPGSPDTLVLLAIVPKIPSDFNLSKGFEP